MYILAIIFFIISLSFILLGGLFKAKKATFLIAGYNTMNSRKKENVDIDALCLFLSKFMYILAACFIIMGIGVLFNINLLQNLGIIVFFGASIFAIIYANTGSRFKLNK